MLGFNLWAKVSTRMCLSFAFFVGLLGFTLDKKTILMVDIAETFLRDVPSFVSQGGQTSVTLKSMAQKASGLIAGETTGVPQKLICTRSSDKASRHKEAVPWALKSF